MSGSKPGRTAVALPLMEPHHPSVDWSVIRWTNGERLVHVTCGDCGEGRFDAAKSVAFRVRRGRFTGRCWGCWQAAHRARESDMPPHPAVNWSKRKQGKREELVEVTCPHCATTRWIGLKSVLRQVRAGEFTGACLRDRLVGRPRKGERPATAGVFWDQVKLQQEGPERRRAMVRVECPECGKERWCQPSHMAAAIRKGTFRAECRTHRTPVRVSIDRRARIWESIWLFGGGLGPGVVDPQVG